MSLTTHLGMVYTTHTNGDESGMVYGIAIPTLEGKPNTTNASVAHLSHSPPVQHVQGLRLIVCRPLGSATGTKIRRPTVPWNA